MSMSTASHFGNASSKNKEATTMNPTLVLKYHNPSTSSRRRKKENSKVKRICPQILDDEPLDAVQTGNSHILPTVPHVDPSQKQAGKDVTGGGNGDPHIFQSAVDDFMFVRRIINEAKAKLQSSDTTEAVAGNKFGSSLDNSSITFKQLAESNAAFSGMNKKIIKPSKNTHLKGQGSPSTDKKLVRSTYSISGNGTIMAVKTTPSSSVQPLGLGVSGCGPGFGLSKGSLELDDKAELEDEAGETELPATRLRASKTRFNPRRILNYDEDENIIQKKSHNDSSSYSSNESSNSKLSPTKTKLKLTDGFGTTWKYSKEEYPFLYKHNSFLIKREQLNCKRNPKHKFYFIYRIIISDGTMLLQEYLPREIDQVMCHFSTKMCEEIQKIDSQFHQKYQPVYYGICYGDVADPNIVHVIWKNNILPNLKCVYELTKYFVHFKNLLKMLTAQIMTMKEIQRVLDEDDSSHAKKSWIVLSQMIDQLSSKIFCHLRWNQKIIKMLKIWPRLTMEKKGVDGSKRRCKVCSPSRRIARRRGIVSGLPYDPIHHNPVGVYPRAPKGVLCCLSCSKLLVGGHRLLHLRNDVFSCILETFDQRVTNDSTWISKGPELMKSILDSEPWAFQMFIEFCITIGEGYRTLQKLNQISR